MIQARRILQLADARSESPARRFYAGQPSTPAFRRSRPVLGHDLARDFRLDLAWPELRLGLEFDGSVKYSGGMGDPTERLLAEKRREDALREAGWTILRVTWEDLGDPERLVGRLRAARQLARERRSASRTCRVK
ncbi:hypothetical protein NKG05_22080 [Oerskovia sp. M15]